MTVLEALRDMAGFYGRFARSICLTVFKKLTGRSRLCRTKGCLKPVFRRGLCSHCFTADRLDAVVLLLDSGSARRSPVADSNLTLSTSDDGKQDSLADSVFIPTIIDGDIKNASEVKAEKVTTKKDTNVTETASALKQQLLNRS